MWPLNQTSVSDPVLDLVGNADQTAITGTSVLLGNDPPGFDFSLGGPPNEISLNAPVSFALGATLGRDSEAQSNTSITFDVDVVLFDTVVPPVTGSVYMYGPCDPWEVEWCCDLSSTTPAVTGMAAAAATEILWALSGRQYGLCKSWIRPCRSGCNTGPAPGWGWPDDETWVRPVLLDGQWSNVLCGGCMDECSCSHTSEVILPGVVDAVIAVYIDGSLVDPNNYRLDDARILVRTDGQEWPLCQDWGKRSGAGTWFIHLQTGRPVPVSGNLAVSELASEFILNWCKSDKCRLPQRVTAIDRNGMTVALDDVQALLKGGQTGLTMCDQFIAAFNPSGLKHRSRVYSPDYRQPRRMAEAPPEALP
jgi:hypothetical protein